MTGRMTRLRGSLDTLWNTMGPPRRWLGRHRLLAIFLILNGFLVGWTAIFSYDTRPYDVYKATDDGTKVVISSYGYIFDIRESLSPISLTVPWDRDWTAFEIGASEPILIEVLELESDEVIYHAMTSGTPLINHTSAVVIRLSTNTSDNIEVSILFWWVEEVTEKHWESQTPWGWIINHLIGYGILLIVVVDMLFLIALTSVIRYEVNQDEEE